MFYHNRKGIGRNFLISLIGVLVCFGIMFYVTNYFVGHAEEATVEQTCRTSVLARAKSVIRSERLGIEQPSKIPLLCKTQEKPPLEGDEDEVMRQISELSAKCWSMFLEGEYYDLFGKADFLSKGRCFICYTFNIKNNMKITREELIEYMNDHYYSQPDEKGEGGLTYLDYIQSYKGDGMVMMRESLKFIGNREQVYSISLMSPDITWASKLKPMEDIVGLAKLIWGKDPEEIENENKLKYINRIYIEDLNVRDILDSCVDLESI